jgi:hypothetical protein
MNNETDGDGNIAIQDIRGSIINFFRPSSKIDIPFNEKIPPEITESLEQFKNDYPEPSKVAFILMRFGNTTAHLNIVEGIKNALEPYGITAIRADEKDYHEDLFHNVLTYIYGCGFGIAVFERIESEDFNPNVTFEVGYMLALGKKVCLLKDKTLKSLHTDLIGRLYKVFDVHDPIGTIPNQLSRWVTDRNII